jgi:CrcB protein
MLLHCFAIGLGGALGSLSRYFLARLLPATILSYFPFQIVCINIMGCFLMGLLSELMALSWSPSQEIKSFLTTGFLGGFTTFSAFSLEIALLHQKNMIGVALAYGIISVSGSILSFFIGAKLIKTCLL